MRRRERQRGKQKQNRLALPYSPAVTRARFQAWREIGHDFDCAVSFATRRPGSSGDPRRCWCGLAERRAQGRRRAQIHLVAV